MPRTIIQTGNPILRDQARPLSHEEVRSKYIQELIDEMRETMRAAPGVGLAAPQIGESLQLVVIEDPAELQSTLTEEQLIERGRVPVPFHVLVNPQLTVATEERKEFFEGCLSVAGFSALTERHTVVRINALDHNGNEFSRTASGWYARILQHEIDHLNGVLYIDRMHTYTFSTMENKSRFWEQSPKRSQLELR
jgi:peptide deformylase